MIRWIFAAAASLALVAAGLVHGFWTDRWTASSDTAEAADLLGTLPLKVGNWEGEDMEVKSGQVGAGVTGCLQRRYFNPITGGSVVIALVNGRPGPVATHTPEVCYGASGYLVGSKKAIRLDTGDPSAQFWTSIAVKTNVTEETKIRLYWAWNAGEGWVASTDAREQFPRFRHPILHKLYVLRDISGSSPARGSAGEGKDAGQAGSETRDEVCEAFLRDFVPAMDQALFGTKDG
jgi:hypothetical protein